MVKIINGIKLYDIKVLNGLVVIDLNGDNIVRFSKIFIIKNFFICENVFIFEFVYRWKYFKRIEVDLLL